MVFGEDTGNTAEQMGFFIFRKELVVLFLD